MTLLLKTLTNHRRYKVHHYCYLLLASTAMLPFKAIGAQHVSSQWHCSGDASGNWLCSETMVSGPQRAGRPEHSLAADNQPANPEEPRVAVVHNLDWVEAEAMTAEQKRLLDKNCCGTYIEPDRDYPDANLNPEQASLRVNANSTETLTNQIALLEGDVQISQGYRQVRSDGAKVNQVDRQITLEGNVQFREPGLLLMGDKAKLNIDSKSVQIDDATYVLHQASVRGTAKSLTRNEDGIIVINDATYSGCEPGDATWQLKTSAIDIDQSSGFATVKNARLEVKDVPVFYFPYIKFPIDDRRSSGLLFPTLSADKENGIDFSQPLYWNMAPNYDATFSPRFIQERGTGLGVEFRHLSSWSETALAAGYLSNDKGGNDDKKIDPMTGLHRNEGEDRYRISLQHQGGAGRPWATFLDLNRVSDMDYFRDLGNLTLDENSRTHLQRRATASYKTSHWNYLIEAQDYQTVTQSLTDQYSILPQLSVNGYYRFANSLVVDLKNQHSVFKHDNNSFITGNRSRLDYSISWDKRWNWGHFAPRMGVKHLTYHLKTPTGTAGLAAQNPSITVPVYAIDSLIFFERNAGAWLSQYKQTFEPRLFYVHSKFVDQSALPDFDTREYTASYDLLFRDSHFSGGDRIADNHSLTMAFTTRFIDQSSGQERFRASLAQALYFEDRKVTLSSVPTASELAELRRDQSPLALQLTGRVAKHWRITGDLVYDTHDNDLEKSSLGIRYNDGQNRLFNFTYRYTRRLPRLFDGMDVDQDLEQTDVSAFIPVGNNFNLVGRWNHDFTHRRELEVFAGFEYNSCCWRASLILRRWLDREDEILFPEENLGARNGVFFQIQFKGLAGTGSRVDTMLKNGIYGYESVENF